MFDGKTGDSLAIANAAVLVRLIEELIAQGSIVSPWSLLLDAVETLETCGDADRSNINDAVRIIREGFMPLFPPQER